MHPLRTWVAVPHAGPHPDHSRATEASLQVPPTYPSHCPPHPGPRALRIWLQEE